MKVQMKRAFEVSLILGNATLEDIIIRSPRVKYQCKIAKYFSNTQFQWVYVLPSNKSIL